MRRFLQAFALALSMLALLAGTAFAAVTWHSGPTFSANADGSFTASGDGSGFGNQPAEATITINALVAYTCRNKGGNEVPGQNPVAAVLRGTADLNNADHNGRGVFNLTVGPFVPAATVGGRDIGCPNGNWQGINPVLVGALTATLTITQGGNLIFSQTISLN
jgi:hypothetical protein